jgi:AraC-like DNA-binding protein
LNENNFAMTRFPNFGPQKKASKNQKGSYIKGTFVLGFREFVERSNGNAEALLEEVGIPVSLLEDPDQLVSYPAFVAMVELAAKQMNMPSFFLEWSLSLDPHFSALGPITLLAQFTRTYGEWLHLALKYWALHTNGCNISLIEDYADGLSCARFINDPDIMFPARQIAEGTLANMVILSRAILQLPNEKPQVVRFQHLKPADITVHEQVFGCPLEFDAPHSELIFKKSHMDLPVSGNLTMLKPALAVYMKHRIRQMPVHDQSATRNTMIAIASTLGSTKCNINFLADSLGINVKKMQRLLAAEDTTFAEVLDKVRENTARRMLVESNAPIAAIAGLLDYSSGAAFTLAFSRWAGVPPLAYRKRERSKRQ